MKKIVYKQIKYTKRLRQLGRKITKEDEIYKLRTFVQSLDLSLLEETLSDSGRGQHPIPLWVPVSVWFYTYKQGELSYRRVSNRCSKDDDYFWLSAGFEPSGAYLESWKLRILPLIPGLTVGYQNYLRRHGLLKTVYFGLDGCKLDCWASKKQHKTEAQIDKEITFLEKD